MLKRAQYFSSSYHEARERLLNRLTERGAERWRYELNGVGPSGEPLSIDVARLGAPEARRALLISSGTHGVEGFFGSAVQLAALDGPLLSLAEHPELAVIYIHAVNPYGFAHRRRVNEQNIDLNRNFLGAEERYEGVDPAYSLLNGLLNPASPPQRGELFWLKTLAQIARHGFQALKCAVAQGQYEFERGLFFGGHGPSRSCELITQHLPEWLGGSERVVHLDLHTGLGRWGSYVLAASQGIPSSELSWLMSHFDQDKVQRLSARGVLYPIRGEFTYACRQMMSDRSYYPILLEVGTFHILRVLSALRAENRVTHWGDPSSRSGERARAALKEVFCPESPAWREEVLNQALKVIQQAKSALDV